MTDVARPDRPGASDLVMGRYRLVEPLGTGGSAEVWRGVDERLGRTVAVKLLHHHLLPDEAARARFKREAEAAAALSHPGIVAVFDAEASPAGAAIIFELVDGEPLSDRLAREGALPVPEAARIGAEVAEALDHAHERGVVHRDVKPANILLDAEGRARLVDFGIARLLEAGSAHLTTAGMITGTLRYLAPEQLAGGEATAGADLYTLGLVLYEMLTGHPAFDPPTPVALIEAQRHPPTDIPGVPADLSAVSLAAMEPDPAKRPSSAGAMASRLREWATPSAGGAMSAEAPSAPDRPGSDDPTVVVPAPQAAAALLDDTPPEAGWPLARPRGRRRREASPGWWPVVISIGLLALVLVVAALVASGLFGGTFGGPGLPSMTPTASPTGTPTASPTGTPTASPTGTPTAVPARSLAEAVAAFERLVTDGRDNGTIEGEAADDLLKLARNVVEERGVGKVRQAIDDLRRAVDEDEREGKITSASLAEQLRSLVEEMAAAVRAG